MKKQIIILAAAIVPLAFFSCKKGSLEPQQANNSMASDEVISNQKIGNIPIINLRTGVAGMFQFNGNLKDKTGQLADAVPSIAGAVLYTTDRKGVVNNAIQFTGRYGVDILNVPAQPNMSVAAWVKYTTVPVPTTPFVYSGIGPNFDQELTEYWGVIITPATSGVPSGVMDDNWHHLVVTYDGNDLRFFVDGKYMGNSNNPCKVPPQKMTYNVGYYPIGVDPYWQGSIDDLYFYSRTLSDADVQKLYMQ